MNRIPAVMRMHLKDKWSWSLIPLMVLFSSFGINLIIGSLIEEPMYTGGLASIYIYMFVAGIIVLSQTFPFALGLSVRRTDYFLGTAMTGVLVSAAWAIVLLLLSFLERETEFWGVGLHFFHLPYLTDGPAIAELGVYFVVMMHLFFFGFVIPGVHKRFGRSGMFLLSIAALLISSSGAFALTHYQWWDNIFLWLSRHTASELAMWMLPAIAVYLLVSYLLLRKATV